ncbi:DUF3223 domain-containing protein [Kitasatospora sp. NPDC057223]|uniref:DUF3223 domain-containing protein n=1 Tax=Kitasatospora sp. NPDC057223 TaxID=3346055 RepID=UPI0036441742
MAFTDFLNQLFDVLGITLIRLAARVRRDKGSVSRYLSGRRIAPSAFIDQLLNEVADTTGNPVTENVRDQAYQLRLKAIKVRNPSKYEIEQLRESLGAAERDLKRADVRERVLLEAVKAAEVQTRQAEQRYRQLESDWATTRYTSGSAALDIYSGPEGGDELRDEIRGLKAELEALRAELSRAQALKHDAEEQCLRLEARLLAAEAALKAQRAKADRTFLYGAELESPGMVLTREFGRKVGTTLDLDTTAGELCDVFVPTLADFASVDLLAGFINYPELPDKRPDDQTMLQRVGRGAHATRGHWDHALELGALFAMPRSIPPGRALQDNEPVLVPVIDAETAAHYAASFPGGPDLAASVTGRSMLVLPLSVRGRILGVLKLIRLPDRPPFDPGDAPFLQGLADRAAVLLDSARLHQAETRLATAMQRSMIPIHPPQIPGVQVAHRYLPGDSKAEVGGDWFDAIQLPGSRVALVIGDVMGHGLHAAQTMGRLRTAIQAFASLDVPPGQLLRHLDNLAHKLGDDHLATCLYAIYDPINRTCELASAGHLPPVLVHPDGRSELLEIPSGAPIGVGGVPFAAKKIDVSDGSTLVLCTDGLVRGDDGDIGEGLAALCGAGIEASQTPDQACDTVLARLHTAASTDDVALLVARLDGIPPSDIAIWKLDATNSEVRRARALVREQLFTWDLAELTETTELLVSELVTNAVRVARGHVQLQLIWLDKLFVEVSDDNHNLPSLEPVELLDEYGRGLQLVSQLANRWGTARKAVGKVVWFELVPRSFWIGARRFRSRGAAEEAMRALLARYSFNAVVDREEDDRLLRDLLDLHPDAEEKVGAGVDFFRIVRTPRGNHKGLSAVQVDGTATDFSYKASLRTPSPRQRQ